MVVGNPCAPDNRVVKQAEFLASQGHNVRIYCTAKAGIPLNEIVNGVEYYRIEFNISIILRKIFNFRKYQKDQKRKQRTKDMITYYKNDKK